MRSRAGGGGEAEEAAAVAGAASFAAIAVNGSLQLARGAEALSLALVRVEVLHVPVEDAERKLCNTEDSACGSLWESGFKILQKMKKNNRMWPEQSVYLLFVKTFPSFGQNKKTTK